MVVGPFSYHRVECLVFRYAQALCVLPNIRQVVT